MFGLVLARPDARAGALWRTTRLTGDKVRALVVSSAGRVAEVLPARDEAMCGGGARRDSTAALVVVRGRGRSRKGQETVVQATRGSLSSDKDRLRCEIRLLPALASTGAFGRSNSIASPRAATAASSLLPPIPSLSFSHLQQGQHPSIRPGSAPERVGHGDTKRATGVRFTAMAGAPVGL